MSEINTENTLSKKPEVLGIDIETFSSVDLPKCGVYRYVEAPDFEILLFAYAFDDEEPQIVDMACGETILEFSPGFRIMLREVSCPAAIGFGRFTRYGKISDQVFSSPVFLFTGLQHFGCVLQCQRQG